MSDHETKFDKWNAAYNEHGKRKSFYTLVAERYPPDHEFVKEAKAKLDEALAEFHQVAGCDARGSASRKSSPAHHGSFTPSNRPHRLSGLRVFRLVQDDPPRARHRVTICRELKHSDQIK